ncbi:88 kda immunoreactive mannoprotein mp88 [Gigaspora margarita]|uniref:88 kDa immunoreactive mannoprotein mp88 n=1 Tax=Gigaspora margarita TaxID=4874 RepID=A0A8H3XEE5_GIGMA|nr:88 kda immunoreactive mannoprotein mp88 [Gigaspora margarita]
MSKFLPAHTKLSLLIFILAVITSIHAIAVNVNKLDIRDEGDPITVTVEDETTFCSFLPRESGQTIGSSASNAVAYCSENTTNAPNARIFPDGFILTKHFASGDGYVQITGLIDGSIYVDPNDGGGQYDIKAPDGAQCTGYDTFVNLVEPDVGHFCIRCCKDSASDKCPR